MKDHKVLRFADGQLSTLADLSEHCGGHLNDLVVDAAGHVFVGASPSSPTGCSSRTARSSPRTAGR
jgi:hypothetical protein